jgi:hypothetical protein
MHLSRSKLQLYVSSSSKTTRSNWRITVVTKQLRKLSGAKFGFLSTADLSLSPSRFQNPNNGVRMGLKGTNWGWNGTNWGWNGTYPHTASTRPLFNAQPLLPLA